MSQPLFIPDTLRSNRVPTRISCGAVALAGLWAAAAPTMADILETKDGRRYEGRILSRDAEMVRIDAMVGRTRVVLGFPPIDVGSIQEKPLAPGFFDPPPAPERVSAPAKFNPGQKLYLEVPIVGRIGEQVFADGVAQVLRYAKAHQIQNIVFTIDSPGGDRDEAIEIYDTLKEFKKSLRFYAIARQCQGPALAVPVWANSIQILPGGSLGVGPEARAAADANLAKVAKAAKKEDDDADEAEIARSQLAYKLIAETGREGLQAELLRAMIVPGHTLCVWKDAEGKIGWDAVCPEGGKEKVFLSVGAGQTLDLTYEQARALGMKEFKGGAQELGALLRLDGWTAESDYGIKTMEKTSAAKQKAAKTKQDALDAKVQANVKRRETTEAYISHSLQEAAKWDPTKASYETYADHWGWGWGWANDYPTKKYTLDSQKKWKTYTDACMHYIQSAAKGLRQMKKLDADAVKLGIDPTYKPGEIDRMLEDLAVRFKTLSERRNTTGK